MLSVIGKDVTVGGVGGEVGKLVGGVRVCCVDIVGCGGGGGVIGVGGGGVGETVTIVAMVKTSGVSTPGPVMVDRKDENAMEGTTGSAGTGGIGGSGTAMPTQITLAAISKVRNVECRFMVLRH